MEAGKFLKENVEPICTLPYVIVVVFSQGGAGFGGDLFCHAGERESPARAAYHGAQSGPSVGSLAAGIGAC